MFGVKINLNNPSERVKKAVDYGQFVLDETALKDSNFYVPEDEQYLQDSGILHSKLGEGELMWFTPYSRRLYYNPQYNFSTDKNPNARGLWWEAAKAENRLRWLQDAEKATKSRL